MGSGALENVRVLEYCRGTSGAFCTKLMADLGAEVIHVERPGTGDDTRRMPPFVGDTPGPENSGLFLFLNTNKLGITLNPELPMGKTIFQRLASSVDVLVEDWPAGHMEALGLGYEHVRSLNPAIVMASITPFGRSGPYESFKAHGLNIAHASGQGFMLPMPSADLERPPVKIAGNCTDYDSGQAAAVAILAALYCKASSGKGQFIEISQQEAVLSLQRVENVVYANSGEVLTRMGPASDSGITKMFRSKDGYVVSVTPQDHQKEALARLRGGTSEVAGEESASAMHETLATWMEQHTSEEICAHAQAHSVPISPINSPADVATSRQLEARQFFSEVTHPVAGVVKMPAQLCRFSKTPFALRRAAPLLGEHNEIIYGRRLGFEPRELRLLAETGVI